MGVLGWLKENKKISKSKTSSTWIIFKQIEFKHGENFFQTKHIACSKCFYFVKNYSVDLGTTNLSRHIKGCCSNMKLDGFAKPVSKVLTKEDTDSFNNALIEFITSTYSPMKIVEDPCFHALIQKAISFGAKYGNVDSKRIITGRKGARTLLNAKFEQVETEITEKLRSAPAKAFSSDMWTASNGHFLDISYSCIDSSFKFGNGQFQMLHFTEKHTGFNILEKLQESFSRIGLTTDKVAITTDSGSNMLKAVKDGDMISIRCICHRYNTVVNEAWKEATKENETLGKLDSDVSSLIEYVNRLGIQSKLPIKLKSGCKTRPWRSIAQKLHSVLMSYDFLLSHFTSLNQELRVSRIDKNLLTKVEEI